MHTYSGTSFSMTTKPYYYVLLYGTRLSPSLPIYPDCPFDTPPNVLCHRLTRPEIYVVFYSPWASRKFTIFTMSNDTVWFHSVVLQPCLVGWYACSAHSYSNPAFFTFCSIAPDLGSHASVCLCAYIGKCGMYSMWEVGRVTSPMGTPGGK